MMEDNLGKLMKDSRMWKMMMFLLVSFLNDCVSIAPPEDNYEEEENKVFNC